MTTKKTTGQTAESTDLDLAVETREQRAKLVGVTPGNLKKYQLPSGAVITMREPTLLDLEQIEEYQLEYPDRPVKHIRLILEYLGVDNLGQLPPTDFLALSALLSDFLG